MPNERIECVDMIATVTQIETCLLTYFPVKMKYGSTCLCEYPHAVILISKQVSVLIRPNRKYVLLIKKKEFF